MMLLRNALSSLLLLSQAVNAESNTGILQPIIADYDFQRNLHSSFCALLIGPDEHMLILDNVGLSDCPARAVVEVETSATDSAGRARVSRVVSVDGMLIQEGSHLPSEHERLRYQLDHMFSAELTERESRAPRSGIVSVLLVRVNTLDSTVDYCDEQCVWNHAWGAVSAESCYAESSYGELALDPEKKDVTSVTVEYNSAKYHSGSSCDFNSLGVDALTSLSNQGFDHSGYDMISFYVPPGVNCDWLGVAYVNGYRSWVYDSYSLTLAHEMGHNFGAIHSSVDSNDDSVNDGEYGDETCVMGGGPLPNTINFNAPHRALAGWMPASVVDSFSCGASPCDNTFEISDTQSNPTTVTANGGRMIVRTKRDSSQDYLVSYRAGVVGLDATLRPEYKNTVAIHYFSRSGAWSDRNTMLVKLLSVGQSYSVTTSEGDLTISMLGASGGVATVHFSYLEPGETNMPSIAPTSMSTNAPTVWPTTSPTTQDAPAETCPPYFTPVNGAGCVHVHLDAGNKNSGRKSCELFGEGLAEVRDEASGDALTQHLRNTLSVDAAFWHPNKRRGPYIALQWSGINSRWEWANGDPLGSYAPWRAGDGGTPTKGRKCVMTTYDGTWASTRCRRLVWAVCSAAESPSSQYRIIESSHPYANDERTRKTVAFPGGSCYRVKFDDASSSHSRLDALKVYGTDLSTGSHTLIKKFHSNRWRDFTFNADAATFVFRTDADGTDYGYKLQLRECNLGS